VISAPSVFATWGSTPAERTRPFACDRWLTDPDDALFRAVDVDAPPGVLFRWLCQLKAAPYSYDWIDNFGRRSPPHLVPGLERLEVGDRVMIFELVEFEPDRHLTMLLRRHLVYGDVAVTYAVEPRAEARSRLIVKLLIRYPRAPVLGTLVRWTAAPLDLIMMRRQLLNLKALAERQTAGA
jgi:hypothetical protein